MALAPERIVEVALDLLNQIGLDGLTTRRLAEQLDVKGPSLYHHFRNKEELLGQMAATMLTRCLANLDSTVSWDEWLRNMAIATRKMMLQYRDGARILTSSSPTQVMRTAIIPAVERPLIAAGFSAAAASEVIGMMASFVIGWTINEQNKVIHDYMQSVLDVERSFSFAVDTIVLGVERRLAAGLMSEAKSAKTRTLRARRKSAALNVGLRRRDS